MGPAGSGHRLRGVWLRIHLGVKVSDVEYLEDRVCRWQWCVCNAERDRDFEIMRTQTTTKKTQKEAPETKPLPDTLIALHLRTCWSRAVWQASASRQGLLIYVIYMLSAAATPPPLKHHDGLCHMTGREPEGDRTMLLVLAISLRDNKRQQKGFQRKNSSISLYSLSLGYWFKCETCTPQEKWQTSTSLSFFLAFSSFRPNLKELRASAD